MNPSKMIDKQIADLDDWRGNRVAKLRKLVHEADPDLKEEWKWNAAVWTFAMGLFVQSGFSRITSRSTFSRGFSRRCAQAVQLRI